MGVKEDLELSIEWMQVQQAFIAAKETRDVDPEAYQEAKAKMSAMRTYWRQIRTAIRLQNEEAYAQSLLEQNVSEARPDPVAMTATPQGV